MSQQLQVPLLEQTENEIDLLEVLSLFARHKILILVVSLLGMLATAGYSFLQPNVYTATATFIPVDAGSGGGISALIGSIGGELGSLASSAGLGEKASGEKFVTLLQTRTMAETIIQDLDLAPVLLKPEKITTLPRGERQFSMQEAVAALRKRLEIKNDKKQGVVLVSFTSPDATLSAKVANAYVAKLDTYLKANALSAAKKNRLFIEQQLGDVKRDMAEREDALKDFQQQNRLVSLDAQTDASVQAYSDLKAKLISGEIELKLLQKSSLEGDPRIGLKEQEVAELRKQISKLERGDQGASLSFAKAPMLGLTYARLKRELLVQEKVFELLTQQYELARIQEAKDDFAFQVLDPAVAPEKKSGPKRAINTLIGLVVSALLGVLLALALELRNNDRLGIGGARA